MVIAQILVRCTFPRLEDDPYLDLDHFLSDSFPHRYTKQTYNLNVNNASVPDDESLKCLISVGKQQSLKFTFHVMLLVAVITATQTGYLKNLK